MGRRAWGARCWVYAIADLVADTPTGDLPYGLRLGRFTHGDIEPLAALGATDVADTARRLARGDRPWGLWEGAELVCYGWSTVQTTGVSRYMTIAPAPDEAYLYDFFTPPAARGRGFYPILLRAMCRALAGEGRTRAWIAVAADNAASLRGIEKAGFRAAGKFWTWSGRLSYVRCHERAPCPPVRSRRAGLTLRLPTLKSS